MPNGMSVYGLNEKDSLMIYRDIFEDHCYRRHGIEYHDGDCILDVGSNTGLFIRYLDEELGVRANVHAFEPIPQIFTVLEDNVADLKHVKAHCFNVGLAQRAGTASFTYYPRMSNASTLRPDESPKSTQRGRDYIISQTHTLSKPLPFLVSLLPKFLRNGIAELVRRHYLKKEMVECTLWSLSEFLRGHRIENVDLLKIDAERSEQEILDGLRDEDWPKIQNIILEVHDGDEATRRIVHQLEAHGFQVTIDVNPAIPSLALVFAIRVAAGNESQDADRAEAPILATVGG